MSYEHYKLQDIVEVTSSKRIHLADYVKDGIPFYRSKEVIERANGNNVSTELYITHKQYDEIKRKHGSPQKNDILLTSVGTLGKAFLVEDGDEFYFKDGNLTWFRNYDQKVLPDYIFYWIKSPITQQKLDEISIGSTQKALTISGLKSLQIALPSLKQQKKIVSIIKNIDHKINNLRKTNKTLESIAQAIFKSWFIDFDPVHAKLQGKECAGIDKATADLFPDSFIESELGLIPKGWEVKTIGECLQVVDFVANGSFAALKENVTLFHEPNYALYVRTTDFNSNFNGDFRFVNEKAFRFLSKSYLVGDETIISNVGDVGTVFRAPKWLGYLMTLGSNAVAIKNKEMPTYVYYFFKSNKGQHLIQSIITGSAQLKFNKTSLRSKAILIPSKSTLDCFENITSAVTEKMDTNQNGIKVLQNIRDTLLPRLISGKLDLSNIEEELEGIA
jgi:type I restriction enzyme S subunit